MEVIFLGTGTSQGVPPIAHDCEGLDLDNPKNWRTRSSIHVVMDGWHVQVDAGPEFRMQCLREKLDQLDTFILTHGHADHLLGMDDLRRFCDLRGWEAIPVYGSEEGLERVRTVFPYAIGDTPIVRGYPAFRLNRFPEKLELPGGNIYATLLPHGPIETLGLVFEEKSSGRKFAYFNDCKEVTPRARELAAGSQVVALDGLRPQPHSSHMSIDEAVAVARDLNPAQAYLTHMTYQVDHETWSAQLPEGIALAWDGLRITV